MQNRNLLSDKLVRIEYFREDFPAFFSFHFGRDFKEFHVDWMESLQSDKNTFIEGFRASRKTTLVRGYVIRCIVYEVEPHIIVQSFEKTLSSARVRNVAKMLFKKSIVDDYGLLFPLETKKAELKKKSLSDFETTNGIKVSSKSLGETLRGANEYDIESETTSRPTLLVLDDIDVIRSVSNSTIIENNMNKILGETISALDPLRRKIIFLGNTIFEDGVVPRFRKLYETSTSRNIFRQPLFIDETNVRPEEFTDEVVQTLKDDGLISWNQNYLLIPYSGGDTIIQRSQIQRANHYPPDSKLVYAIDPAFSLKTTSDSLGFVCTAHYQGNYYIYRAIEFKGQEKDEENVKAKVKGYYDVEKPSIINVESNNGGEIIARQLQNLRLAVKLTTATRDKITRLTEVQGHFTRGQVFFLPGTEKLVEQLLMFPNADHDDLVDAMVYSFYSIENFDIYIG